MPETLPLQLGAGHRIAFGLLFVGIAAVASAEAARLVAGWPWNSNADPVFAGPGDQVAIYLPDEITSIKGYWNGKATVELLNAQELGLAKARLPAISKEEKWGSFLLGRGSKRQKSQLWAGVTVPPNPELAGKTMRMHITLDVKYPTSKGLMSFADEGQTFQHTAELRLAPPHAGLKYRWLWWGGGAGRQLDPARRLLALSARPEKEARRFAFPSSSPG